MSSGGGLLGALAELNRRVNEGADLLAAQGESPFALSSALLASLGRYRAALDLGSPREIANAEVEAIRAGSRPTGVARGRFPFPPLTSVVPTALGYPGGPPSHPTELRGFGRAVSECGPPIAPSIQ